MRDERRGDGERIVDPIDAAQAVSDWLGDYLDGAIDVPRTVLPPLADQRLRKHYGDGEDRLALMRDSVSVLEFHHQMNLTAYFCGFPDEALDMMVLDATIDESISALNKVLEPTESPADIEVLDLYDLMPGETMVERRQRLRLELPAKAVGRTAAQAVVYAHHWSDISNRDALALRPTGIMTGPPNLGTNLTDEDHPLAWQNDALCAEIDPELFFPEKGGSTLDAKKICAICEVQEACLNYALENDERFGIWGGVSERDRRQINKGRTSPEAALALEAKRQQKLRNEQDAATARQSKKEAVLEAKRAARKELAELSLPRIQQARRIDQFIRIVGGDASLEDLYADQPEMMARTTYVLLDVIYPESAGAAAVDRQRRLQYYFLDKKWNRLEEEFGNHGQYWDLIALDLSQFTKSVERLKDEHRKSGIATPFAEYYLEQWQPDSDPSVLTSRHYKRRPAGSRNNPGDQPSLDPREVAS